VGSRLARGAARRSKGGDEKHLASPEEPAYFVEQDDGGRVLRNHSALRKER